MNNCWLSPEGEVIYCINHDAEAWKIIKERFGLSPSEVREPSIFLGERGWMAYMNRIWQVGWWCYYYGPDPTQKQIDKIFDLTGELYERKRGIVIYLFSYSLFGIDIYLSKAKMFVVVNTKNL